MFYFLMQLAALLAGALALGLLVGWMLWARALRHHRRGHAEQVNVLHKQLASLADENRRVQQRFAATSADLDSERLVMQARDTELRRAREAFTVSQQNLAGAETQLTAAQGQLAGQEQQLDLKDAQLGGVGSELAALQTEASGLRLDSAEAKALRVRVEELTAQISTLDTRAVDAETQVAALHHDVALATDAASKFGSRSTYLGRALDAAVARANDRGEAQRSEQAALVARTASEHQARLQRGVSDAHTASRAASLADARADVRALTATWEQISHRHAQQLRARADEVALLRRKLATAESSVVTLRADMAGRLESMQRQTLVSGRTEADARASAALARMSEEHAGAFGAVAARHDRQLADQAEAHQLAISHWRNDMAQRTAAREADHATISELQAEARSANDRLAAVRSDLDRVALERHLLDEQSQRHHGELEQLSQSSQASQSAVDSLQAQLEAAQRSASLDSANQRAEAETLNSTVAAANLDGSAWKRELEELREVHRRAVARLHDLSARTADHRSFIPEARRLRVGDSIIDSQRPTADVIDLRVAPLAARTETSTAGSGEPVPATAVHQEQEQEEEEEEQDDLQVIEGVGPKIAAALRLAGISTFVRLEVASPDQLRDALASSGLTFAPSLPTWSKQAGFLVRADAAGLAEYQADLTAGREVR